MDEVKKEKEARRLTQAELDGIRELGVELHYESDGSGSDEDYDSDEEESLSGRVAYHIRKIDEIYMQK